MVKLASLAFVLLLVSGCLGDGGDAAPTPSPTETSTTSSASTQTTPPPPPPRPPVIDLLLGFELTSCRGIAVQHARPLEDIQALLPEGFVAAPAPGSADPRGVVTVELHACGNFTVAGTVVPATYFGAVSTYIARPDERVPGAPQTDIQEYLFRVLAGEDVLAILWRAAGYDTYNASAVVSVAGAGLPIDPGARTASASVGAYTFLADGAQAPGLGGLAGAFTRYTALADGSVLVWTGTYELGTAAIGPGAAQLPDDDPVASLGVGPPGQVALSGTSRLHDAGAFRAQDLRRVFTPASA